MFGKTRNAFRSRTQELNDASTLSQHIISLSRSGILCKETFFALDRKNSAKFIGVKCFDITGLDLWAVSNT